MYLFLENDKLLGMRRFSRIYASTREDSIQGAVRSIVKQADAVLSGVQDDDWTFVLLEWDGASGTEQRSA